MQELINKGGSGGGYKFSANREGSKEEHKVGFTILEPIRRHRGREQSKQASGAPAGGWH